MQLKSSKGPVVVVAVVLGLSALVAACGGDDDNGGGQATDLPTPTMEAAGPAATATLEAENGGTSEVESFDNGYTPSEITVPAGEEITLEYENVGDAPHTFTIDGLVDSGTLSGGESTTLTFTADEGTYTFYCVVHGEAAMSGTLTAE